MNISRRLECFAVLSGKLRGLSFNEMNRETNFFQPSAAARSSREPLSEAQLQPFFRLIIRSLFAHRKKRGTKVYAQRHYQKQIKVIISLSRMAEIDWLISHDWNCVLWMAKKDLKTFKRFSFASFSGWLRWLNKVLISLMDTICGLSGLFLLSYNFWMLSGSFSG